MCPVLRRLSQGWSRRGASYLTRFLAHLALLPLRPPTRTIPLVMNATTRLPRAAMNVLVVRTILLGGASGPRDPAGLPGCLHSGLRLGGRAEPVEQDGDGAGPGCRVLAGVFHRPRRADQHRLKLGDTYV